MRNTGGVISRVSRELCEKYVSPYVARIRRGGLSRLGPKQVHDALWGTISLRPLEVVLLDSPLFQRLRHLRQLGVAHWVYPGADHSRFEHSLGVLFQAQQLVSAINRAGLTKYNEAIIKDDEQQLVRFSALLHDVGHPVLSHVSEYALRLDPKILLEVQRERKAVGEKVTVSELIAAEIIRSDIFVDFLRVIAAEHGKSGLATTSWATNPEDFTDKAAKIILGQNVSTQVPLMHEIVSGPYDADKLDYMVRDPRAAGLPTIVDISRLVQKLTVIRLSSRELPQSVARMVPQATREAYLFGFPWSGLSVIDELLLARIMLYSKLYRHPKVASIESIVQALLDQLAVIVSPLKLIKFIYDILDDELVLADRKALLMRLDLQETDVSSASQAKALKIALDLLRRLRERELFVRGFAFFPSQPDSDNANDGVFDRILKYIDDAAKRDELRNEIVAEVRNILRILGESDDSPLYQNADQLIVLRRLQPPSQKELRHAWIFPTGGSPRTFDKTSIHKEAWSSSFVSASPKAYLFCPKELAQAVFIGAEAVISPKFKVKIPEYMMEELKQSYDTVSATKLALRKRGYHANKEKIIRPLWPRLSMSDVDLVVSHFANRFSIVQEAVASAIAAQTDIVGAEAMKARAYAWLDQFSTDADIDCALILLKHAKIISRQDIVASVKRFIDENLDFRAASVISLSKGNDSSQVVQYYSADVGGELHFYGSLAEAASAKRDAPVLIVDDFCASGYQWSNLIGQLFGNTELRRPELNEQRSLGLEPELDYLRERKIAFVFTAGWDSGKVRVKEAADKVSLDAHVHIHIDESSIPFAEDVLQEECGSELTTEFLHNAGGIGSRLLGQMETAWPNEKIASRCLGYGNRGMLLFFPYNAPSQTLTCMWAGGSIDGELWDPLVRRRKKL